MRNITSYLSQEESRLALTGVLSRYSLLLDMNKWGPVLTVFMELHDYSYEKIDYKIYF